MRIGLFATAAFLLSSAVASSLAAQSAAPATESSRLDVVEVVGCLAEQPKGTWLVSNATEPVVAKEPYTNQSAIQAAQARPLGDRRYILMAISMFKPEVQRGHKVAVKGLLIRDAKGDRLNVTSLQTAAATCP